MAVKDWTASAASNTSVGGVSIAEGCLRENMNNMGRAIMAEARAQFDLIPTLTLSAAGDGTTDDTTAVQAAITAAGTSRVMLDGAGKSYRLTAKVNIPSNLKMRNARFIIDHTGTGFGQATAGGGGNEIARCYFENVSVEALQNAAIGWDLVTFQNCLWVNCKVVSNDGTHKFTTGRKYSNVSYWNVELGTEIAEAVIPWSLDDANDSRFYGCRHVKFGDVGATATVKFAGACSGIEFFGLSCETVFTSANVIDFHASCQANRFIGFRIEARTGSTTVLPIKFNGATGNVISGGYILGAGITAVTDTIGDNEVEYFTASGSFRHMGTGVLRLASGTTNPDTVGQITYHTGDARYKGYNGGGLKEFTMNPADEDIDFNGNDALNLKSIKLSSASTIGATAGALTEYLTITKSDGTVRKVPLYASS